MRGHLRKIRPADDDERLAVLLDQLLQHVGKTARPAARVRAAEHERVEARQFRPRLWEARHLRAPVGFGKLHKRAFAARKKRGEREARVILKNAAQELELPAPRVFEEQHFVPRPQHLHAELAAQDGFRSAGRSTTNFNGVFLQTRHRRLEGQRDDLFGRSGGEGERLLGHQLVAILQVKRQRPSHKALLSQGHAEPRLRTQQHAARGLHLRDADVRRLGTAPRGHRR